MAERRDARNLPARRTTPPAIAKLRPAPAPIRVCTNSETSAGNLAVHLARPLDGMLFPHADETTEMLPGQSWNIGGVTVFNPGLALLGMSWFDDSAGPPASGLLVGRMERRAWLAGQRLLPQEDLYSLQIHLDPGRIELADLEVEVEERFSGEVVLAERLRMEDVMLGPVIDEPRVSIALPTLGRAIKRSVRLHDRDRLLLQRAREDSNL